VTGGTLLEARSDDAGAIMHVRCTHTALDEAPGETDPHHPQSEKDKRRFPRERVVIYFESLDRIQLRKLLLGRKWPARRWKSAKTSKVYQLLLREPLHVGYHLVGNSILKHPLVRHMSCHISGVRGITGK